MDTIYKQLYEMRVTHTKNVKALLSEMIDSISSLVIMAANAGVTEVDSTILLDVNRKYVKALGAEQTRFEEQMNKVLDIRKDKENEGPVS